MADTTGPADAGTDPTFDPAEPAPSQPIAWPPLPAATPRREPRSRRVSAALVLVVAMAALFGSIVGAVTTRWATDRVEAVATTVTTTLPPATTTSTLPADPSLADVARAVIPSIVVVQVGTATDDGFVGQGGGSGVIFDDRHIVTNHHVIADAAAIQITFSDGTIVPATLVGSDDLTDLAVVTVDRPGLVPLATGSTEDISVGDSAYTVGNPQLIGGGPSVTAGVVSALNRSVTISGRDHFGLLQTDAPFTRGSSGGALVDGRGLLIGITTGVGVSDYGQEGVGFVIPIEIVERIVADLIEDGVVTHAFLGVSGSTHYPESDDGSSRPAGVLVEEVIADTAAADAGVATGDVIVAVDGFELTTMEDLVVRMRLRRVDDVVQLVVDRSGERLTFDITLRQRPEGV
ncbi:MAG: trypsin-like peptidase domain-containing protein [Acidimicrobiia bacterium]